MFSRANGPRKLRRKSELLKTVIAGLAIVFSGVTLLAARSVRQAEVLPASVQIVSQDDMIDLPIPSRTVAKGEPLRLVEFRLIKWPRSKVNTNYLQSIEPYKDFFAQSQLPANLPIPVAAISNAPLDANAVAEAIPQGMRAITVKVDAESAVEGWARTGNSIDVILVRTSKESSLGMESLVIAENIKILSAGATTSNNGSAENAARAPNTVTLLVSQEDALKVKTAGNVGRLTFALRGNGDVTPTVTTSIDGKRLLGQSRVETRAQNILGKAKGPDGRTYVLDQDSKWLRSTEELTKNSLKEQTNE